MSYEVTMVWGGKELLSFGQSYISVAPLRNTVAPFCILPSILTLEEVDDK